MRPVCSDCGVKPPETNTNYTLISRTGWRLSRRKETDGAVQAEWRCSECWARHRVATKPAGQAAVAASRAPGEASAKTPSRPTSQRGPGDG